LPASGSAAFLRMSRNSPALPAPPRPPHCSPTDIMASSSAAAAPLAPASKLSTLRVDPSAGYMRAVWGSMLPTLKSGRTPRPDGGWLSSSHYGSPARVLRVWEEHTLRRILNEYNDEHVEEVEEGTGWGDYPFHLEEGILPDGTRALFIVTKGYSIHETIELPVGEPATDGTGTIQAEEKSYFTLKREELDGDEVPEIVYVIRMASVAEFQVRTPDLRMDQGNYSVAWMELTRLDLPAAGIPKGAMSEDDTYALVKEMTDMHGPLVAGIVLKVEEYFFADLEEYLPQSVRWVGEPGREKKAHRLYVAPSIQSAYQHPDSGIIQFSHDNTACLDSFLALVSGDAGKGKGYSNLASGSKTEYCAWMSSRSGRLTDKRRALEDALARSINGHMRHALSKWVELQRAVLPNGAVVEIKVDKEDFSSAALPNLYTTYQHHKSRAPYEVFEQVFKVRVTMPEGKPVPQTMITHRAPWEHTVDVPVDALDNPLLYDEGVAQLRVLAYLHSDAFECPVWRIQCESPHLVIATPVEMHSGLLGLAHAATLGMEAAVRGHLLAMDTLDVGRQYTNLAIAWAGIPKTLAAALVEESAGAGASSTVKKAAAVGDYNNLAYDALKIVLRHLTGFDTDACTPREYLTTVRRTLMEALLGPLPEGGIPDLAVFETAVKVGTADASLSLFGTAEVDECEKMVALPPGVRPAAKFLRLFAHKPVVVDEEEF